MRIQGIIDPKKKPKVLDALKRGDISAIRSKKKLPKPALEANPTQASQLLDSDNQNPVHPQIRRRSIMPQSQMTDSELVDYAKSYVKKQGIRHRLDLCKYNQGLFTLLRKRCVLDKVLSKSMMTLDKMNDNDLVDFVILFIKRNKIMDEMALRKKSPALYRELKRRNLVPYVFQ
jgi:hypothetical protein